MYQNNMLWQISLRKNFLCTSGEKERWFSPDFPSSATLKLEMPKGFCRNILMDACFTLGGFYFSGMGMEKLSASVPLIVASFSDLIARPRLT